MLDESAGAVRQDVGQAAGEPDLVSRSTVLNVVHEEGARPVGGDPRPGRRGARRPPSGRPHRTAPPRGRRWWWSWTR